MIDQDEEWKAHVARVEDEPTASPDDVVWADAVLFGSPTRFGNNTVHHVGGILVTPGYTDPVKFEDGNPYGASLVTGGDDESFDEPGRNAVDHLVERVVDITDRLLRGSTD